MDNNETVVVFFNDKAQTVFAGTVNGGADKIEYTSFCGIDRKDESMKNNPDNRVVWTGLMSDFKFVAKIRVSAEEERMEQSRICPPPRIGW